MKKILLLGAGYGNMGLLKAINKEVFTQAQWTLINNTPYHYKTIALHDVASGKHNRSVLFPLKEVLDKNIEIIEDTIQTIESQHVIGKNANYEYDYLIVGLGFSSDSFGIPGVAQYTKSITSYDSARMIQAQITNTLQSYIENKDSNNLSFIVCGGGFTGIEFAGSLAQEVKKQCDVRGIDFKEDILKLVEKFNDFLVNFAKAENAVANAADAVKVARGHIDGNRGAFLPVAQRIVDIYEVPLTKDNARLLKRMHYDYTGHKSKHSPSSDLPSSEEKSGLFD